MADDAQKTEQPTAKRLKDARKEGQFAKTPDAATWVAIAAGVTLLPRSVSETGRQARMLLARLPEIAADPTPARALEVLNQLPMAVLRGAGPVCLAAALGAVLATAAQGVHPSGKMLKPKFNRMSPKQGLKRMFGMRAAWEALKSVLKVTVIAIVLYLIGRKLIPELTAAGTLPLSATVNRAHSGLNSVIWSATLAGLVLAVADYFYQSYTTNKQLKMSLREIKDEYKQNEGDPQVKGQIRQRQMAMSRSRMMAAIPTADVVLVNPTHLAVALKYSPGRGAPRVVAKGADAVALKIREVARAHRVAIVEDKPLARTIYKICEIDEEIPSELYVAVARILAFVMAAGRPTTTSGVRKPPAETTVPDDLPTRGQLRVRRARELRAAKNPDPD
jgi:flagellar biosynthesis protein FlhB